MITDDPGHGYILDVFDNIVGDPIEQRLDYVKREGEGYPGNTGHHPGTNCQEVLRSLIDRVNYLQKQIASSHNIYILHHLRSALMEFEERAASRHGRTLPYFSVDTIELQSTCKVCGHIGCNGNHKEHS